LPGERRICGYSRKVYHENRRATIVDIFLSVILLVLVRDGKLAMLMASNFRSKKQHLRIDLKNLPWKAKVKVTSWRIDENHEFAPEQAKQIDPENPVLFLNLPSATVLLVQLQPELTAPAIVKLTE
jgi:hypothetical protein